MTPPTAARFAAAALAGAGVAGALVVVLEASNDGLVSTGWALVWLLAGAGAILGGGFVWSRLERSGERTISSGPDFTVCSACEGRVRDDWRLCPHCGASLVDEPRPPQGH